MQGVEIALVLDSPRAKPRVEKSNMGIAAVPGVRASVLK